MRYVIYCNQKILAIADSVNELKKWTEVVIRQVNDADTLQQCNIYVFNDSNEIIKVMPLVFGKITYADVYSMYAAIYEAQAYLSKIKALPSAQPGLCDDTVSRSGKKVKSSETDRR